MSLPFSAIFAKREYLKHRSGVIEQHTTTYTPSYNIILEFLLAIFRTVYVYLAELLLYR
jgi:hypothetical protein